MRIVSLVPSLSHMVCDFGLQEAVVGCTGFCVEPPSLRRTAQAVGGTKDPDLDKVRALGPTHILVNEEENTPEHIAACQAIAPTFVCLPKSPGEVPALLRAAGRWLGREDEGEHHAGQLERELARLAETVAERERHGAWHRRRYLYFIWREPYMVVSPDTYISGMLDLVGLVNGAPSRPRYPTLTSEEAWEARTDLWLLSSEPYPFRQRDAARMRAEWPGGDQYRPELLKIDGQRLSWYGTLTLAGVRALGDWVRGEAVANFVRKL